MMPAGLTEGNTGANKGGQGLYFTINNAHCALQKTIYGDKLGIHSAPLLYATTESVAGDTIIDWSLRLA